MLLNGLCISSHEDGIDNDHSVGRVPIALLFSGRTQYGTLQVQFRYILMYNI